METERRTIKPSGRKTSRTVRDKEYKTDVALMSVSTVLAFSFVSWYNKVVPGSKVPG